MKEHYIVRDIKLSSMIDGELLPESKVIKDFFDELFNGLVETKDNNGDIIWSKNGINYMRQDLKNERMRLNYDHIWSFFESKLDYNYNEISELTTGMLGLYLNRKVFPTKPILVTIPVQLGLYLNRKVFPTGYQEGGIYSS